MFAFRRARSIGPAACGLMLLAILAANAVAAAPTAEQKARVRSADTALKKAMRLYRAARYADAGAAVTEAQDSLGPLIDDASPELTVLVSPVLKELVHAREQLATQGVNVPPRNGVPDEAGKPSTVSFTKQVAPLLVVKCGACHVQRFARRFQYGQLRVAQQRLARGGCDHRRQRQRESHDRADRGWRHAARRRHAERRGVGAADEVD